MLKGALIGGLIKHLHKMFEQAINENMTQVNMTRSQMEVLGYAYIKSEKGIEVNQVDIEKDLNLKNPTVTGLVSRLEKKGYMKREKSSKGPNYKSIIVTEKGKAIIENGKEITDKVEKEMFSVLTKEEKNELTRLIKKVIDNKNFKK